MKETLWRILFLSDSFWYLMTKASRDYAHYQHYIFKFYFIFSMFYFQVSSKKTLAFSLVCCFTLLYLSSQTYLSAKIKIIIPFIEVLRLGDPSLIWHLKKDLKLSATIIFILFWDFLAFEQIFLSLQVKRSVINSNKLVIEVASWVAERLKT